MFVRHLSCENEAPLPLGQSDQCALAVLANDGVSLPVAYATLLLHDHRAFINAGPVLDRASALLAARVSFPMRLLATQVPPQVTTTALICVYVQVDRLMADF